MPLDIIDYSNTVFYKIYCNDESVNDIYVGHTTNFVQRKYTHKRTCIKENYPNHHLKVYKCIRKHGGWDNWKMDIIGFQDCFDHYEARKVEQKYFETLHATLNSIEPLPKPKPRPTTVPKEKQEKRVWHCDLCKTTCLTNNAFVAHEETKKHKRNSVLNNDDNKMKSKKSQNSTSIGDKFFCEKCNYRCKYISDYDRHLLTTKHKINTNGNEAISNVARIYDCNCGKNYTTRSGLWKHEKLCAKNTNKISIIEKTDVNDYKSMVMLLINDNKELRDAMKQQNKDTWDIIKELLPK